MSTTKVSIAWRPSLDSSDMISKWKAGRGFKASINRRNPGRVANSAPEIPSSTNTTPSSTAQPLRAPYWRACSTCRHGLRLIGDAGLIGAPAGVDRSNHYEARCSGAGGGWRRRFARGASHRCGASGSMTETSGARSVMDRASLAPQSARPAPLPSVRVEPQSIRKPRPPL